MPFGEKIQDCWEQHLPFLTNTVMSETNQLNQKRYTAYHVHSSGSCLDGYSSPEENVSRAKELGMTALGLSDHGNITNIVDHFLECRKAGIKPILGIEMYVSRQNASIKKPENRGHTHMVCFARNYHGYKQLLKMVSESNKIENFYYKPRLHLFNDGETPGIETFADGSIICISGHQGSHLSDNLFCDVFGDVKEELPKLKAAYKTSKEQDIDYYRQFLKPNWLEDTCGLAIKMEEKLGGKGNFFIELQNELDPNDELALWIHPLIVDCLRQVSKETGIQAIASSDPHYAYPEQAVDQRLMVMNNMKETETSVRRKLDSSDEMDLMVFFGSNNFYIHSYEEMREKFSCEELEATNRIADEIEEYDITRQPFIPTYQIPKKEKGPKGLAYANERDEYLAYLCVEGAKKIKPWEITQYSKNDYWERIKIELDTFFEAKLSDYFLLVWDICQAARNRPADHSFDWMKNLREGGETDPITMAWGRGSSAGCLVSYLIGITEIDPLMYDLSFVRFYNKGRAKDGHYELPDIDLDFDVESRNWVFDYLRHKYGTDRVGQIMTVMYIKGKAAIKDVFRIKDVPNGYEIANQICKFVGEESKIAADIQEMKDAGEDDYNILRWSIDNSEDFRKYYEDPKYKDLIDQAVRCEGVIRGTGKHAAGVIISDEPLYENFPVVLDTKSKQPMIGFSKKKAEKVGGCKIDILGVAVLSKLKYAQNLINRKGN